MHRSINVSRLGKKLKPELHKLLMAGLLMRILVILLREIMTSVISTGTNLGVRKQKLKLKLKG
jgi:hypothetical protein